MTREQYLEYRRKGDFLPVAYEYYTTHGGTMSRENFYANFVHFASNGFMYPDMKTRQVMKVDVNFVWEHYNKHFEVQELYNSKGQLLAVM